MILLFFNFSSHLYFHHFCFIQEAIEVQEKHELEPSLYGIKPILKEKFNIPAARELILSILHNTLDGQVYTAQNAKILTTTLANEISKSIKGLEQNRYKHIVQVSKYSEVIALEFYCIMISQHESLN